MRNKWKLLFALLAIFSLVAAACGDDDDDASSEESSGEEEGGEDEGGGEEAATQDFCLEIEGSSDATVAAAPQVGMTFDLLGRGDQSFNDAAACGLDEAVAQFGVSFTEIVPDDASARETNLQLQAENSDLVIGNGFSFDVAACNVGTENPDVFIAITDAGMADCDPETDGNQGLDNVAGMVFAEEQGSFLVGAAAGLKTETNKVGFIGGVSGIGLIEKFEAGFSAGVAQVNPDAEVVVQYITEFPDFAGFESPDRGKEIAAAMFDEGADIVYAAAGLSGSGMFVAAQEYSEANDAKVWGIGVDSDQYLTVDPAQQEYVLTSMLKRVDTAVFRMIESVGNDAFISGPVLYDLAAAGVDYSSTGGFVDDISGELDDLKAQIIAGDITVPTAP